MKAPIWIFVLLLTAACGSSPKQHIDLSGKWKFRIDSLDQGINQRWFAKELPDHVTLPGSMATNEKGNPVSLQTRWTGLIVDSSFFKEEKYAKYRTSENFKVPFWLQPKTHYVGAAWYQKEIEIPSDWSDRNITLHLERCHWETRVWIDEQEAGMQNSLSTPHQYVLSALLSPGKHMLTIRVDNRIKDINPGINAHSITDHTQSNWNGIVGTIQLSNTPLIYIKDLKVYPNIAGKKAVIDILIDNRTASPESIKLDVSATGFNTKITAEKSAHVVTREVAAGLSKVTVELNMGRDVLLWDEFNPNLYRLEASLNSPQGNHKTDVNFGMREFKANGSRFQVNNQPVFLRGTLESSIFPKTGYPSTDVDDWIRIFNTCKSHGLNHVRFHSHCPPEAAFEAADQVGIYLQVECGSWANNGSSIGDGKPIDEWLYQEADRILEAYGNHPSFCLMAYGNEPAGGNQKKYLGEWVTTLKNKDNRRVYTGGAGWPAIDENDFHNLPDARIQGWGQGLNSIINKEPPQTAYDFKEIIQQTTVPYVSHEIGQWCVYPNFKEINKYTGVLEAKNFELFQETLEENGLGHLADSLLLASGKLQALCYKAEIEAALRTPGFAGFQLLDLHDFPGQGTALVGVLDAFWEEKGYITPREFSKFCNQTVPLARMDKRVFTNDEAFLAELEVAHFGAEPLESPDIDWSITDDKGNQIKAGGFDVKKLIVDNAQKLGSIDFDLEKIKEPTQMRLEVSVNQYSNHWDFWVYPTKPETSNEKVYITNSLDKKAIQVLSEGGNVLWSLKKGDLSPEFGGNIKVGFSSIFWNTAWTRGQAPHTLGILCDPKHDALKEFPTEYHSNWQWWDAMNHGQAIILDNFSTQVEPIVRIVDDWFENRSLGLVFEARVSAGKIIVCGADLLTGIDERPEARQLMQSLATYINSPQFDPKSNISLTELETLVK